MIVITEHDVFDVIFQHTHVRHINMPVAMGNASTRILNAIKIRTVQMARMKYFVNVWGKNLNAWNLRNVSMFDSFVTVYKTVEMVAMSNFAVSEFSSALTRWYYSCLCNVNVSDQNTFLY